MPSKSIEVGTPRCGCIVWQEGAAAHIKVGHPEPCSITQGVRSFVDQAHGEVVLVQHGPFKIPEGGA